MSTENLKQQLFGQLALVGKALGHANRLELLDFLAQGEHTVENLSIAAGLSVANTSQHLKRLSQAGLVVSRKEGLHVHYRLSGPSVVDLLAILRGVAEINLAEISQLIADGLKSLDDTDAVPAEDLMKRIRDGGVTVLDVRPATEYASGHLPGAVNVPMEELEQRLGELPEDHDVVAYCRGPYCVLAYKAVEVLRKKGFKARRLQNGFPEWEASLMPVEDEMAEK